MPVLQAFLLVLTLETQVKVDERMVSRALGFLHHLLLFSETVSEVIRRHRLLGIQIGRGFAASFRDNFIPDFARHGYAHDTIFREYTDRRSVRIEEAFTRISNDILGLSRAGYRVFETSPSGFLGLAPKGTEVGDDICVLSECSVPILLRREGEYRVHIGSCYVLGLMDGEARKALVEGKCCIQEFELK
jgi:hypothetical protein